MEKVLVTGATGYIGLHCIHQLLNQGYAVNGSVRSPERKDEIFEALKKSPNKLLKLFPSFLESMIVTAELAKFNVNGLKGSIRLKGLFFVYLATFYSWIDDKTLSLEKTMTALDKNLDQAEKFSKFIKWKISLLIKNLRI